MKKIIIAVALIAIAAFVLITNGHKATVTGEASPAPVVETNHPITLTASINASFETDAPSSKK